MLIKRVLVILLVACFLSSLIAPMVALAADDSDGPTDGQRIAAGLGLIALAIWLSSDKAFASKDKDSKFATNKPEQLPQSSKKNDQGVNMELSFANAGYIPNVYDEPFMEPKDEWRSPELKVGLTW